jgi:hypothetical protein
VEIGVISLEPPSKPPVRFRMPKGGGYRERELLREGQIKVGKP